MSFQPRPCLHCGGPEFHVVPGVQLEVWRATSVLGMDASQKMTGGRRWSFTLVICTQCGRTETFTTNGAEVASFYPEAQRITTSRPA
ncbi:MAG: hypothetical protein U0230_10300 [Polyangiales bacterium]